MNTYADRPDGEFFADAPQQPVPPADTWEGLSINQLIDAKNALTTRAFQYQHNSVVLKSLHAGIQRLDALIDQRLTSS
jgi:hypothetical protein